MDEIKVNLENLTDAEREQLLSIIEKANKPKNKVWKPKYGEYYWYINEFGYVYRTHNTNSNFDEWHIASGNYYQTEAEAKFARGRIIVTQELQNYANEHNEYEIDWNNEEQYKYFLCYGYETKGIFVTWTQTYKRNNIYFTSKETARAAIKTIGEERVKKYYLEI